MLLGCAEPGEQTGQLQLKLPKALREISGLAALSESKLLAVADERAQIYLIDFETLDAAKFARMGNPARKGDFEGIAVLDETLYLVTSDGEMWRRSIDGDAENFEVIDTGIGKRCEVEGLTAWAERRVLLVLCKTARTKALRGQLAVFAWSTDEARLRPELSFTKAYDALGVPRLHPSGLSLSADRQRLFIVAAREQYFLETSLDGEFIRGGRLPHRKTHPQAEGVVVTGQNTLYLADEGGKGRGTVTRYEPSF